MNKLYELIKGLRKQVSALSCDKSGAQMVEVLIVILIVIIVGGLVVGFVTGAVPDLMERVINRIGTVFNL
jgi:hypothetical protein